MFTEDLIWEIDLSDFNKVCLEVIDASETGVLVDLLLKCLSKFLTEDEEKERKMNILRFVKSGAVENMCRAITVAHLSIAAKISCVGLLARAARDPEVANRLCQYDEAEQAPPLFMLSTVLLRVVTPFQLRCVIIDFIDTVIPTSADLQSFLSPGLGFQKLVHRVGGDR